MRVLIVAGIFPPDIGGPATHAADIRSELIERGHDVLVMSLTSSRRRIVGDGLVLLPRSHPWPVRTARAVAWIARHARRFDVVYATGLGPVAVAGARLARRPVILKIVGDPAWERGARRGLTDDSFEQFQESSSGGFSLRAMRAVRNWSARNATSLVTPSEHLAESVRRWTGRTDVTVIPNGARAPSIETRTTPSPVSGLRFVFVGRLVPVKRVEVLIEAVALTSSVFLEIVGDGPELDRLRDLAAHLGTTDQVCFVGALEHDAVLQRIAASHALVLASSHEGLPHVVIEALAAGTPVVTSSAGGVTEVLTHDVDALIVEDATPQAFAETFARLVGEPRVLERLSKGALTTGLDWRLGRCADRVEELLHRAAGPPRAVYLARSRMSVPPRRDDELKYELHKRHLQTVVVCPARRAGILKPGGATVVGLPALRLPVVGTVVFYGVAPIIALALAAGRRRSAIICQSPYEGVGVVALSRLLPRGLRPRVQIELHGDWRTATRMYGSSHRRLISGPADRIGLWALRRADRVRSVSEVLTQLARDSGFTGPLDRFVTFSDFDLFLSEPTQPLPEDPNALFVGVLELYKALDILFEAWPTVVRAVPAAHLTIVGAGSLHDQLRAMLSRDGLRGSVTMLEPVPRPDLRRLIDDSTCLVLPSRSEGLARIVVEAMARGRPVVASRVGGIEELVEDTSNGRLVTVEDAPALAEALIDVLSDRVHATSMGAESRRRAVARNPLREYEAGIERLAHWIGAGRSRS